MWYAVWVKTGEEENVKKMCCKLSVDVEVMEQCVVPKFECMKRYLGEWHKKEEILFPGYLFIQSRQPEYLWKEMKRLPEYTRILGDDEMLIPLYEHETWFLENSSQNECLVSMSYGYMEGEQVVITQGPMKDFSGIIKQIDRHKRLATLEISFFGRATEVKLGLEIIRKLPENQKKEEKK